MLSTKKLFSLANQTNVRRALSTTVVKQGGGITPDWDHGGDYVEHPRDVVRIGTREVCAFQKYTE